MNDIVFVAEELLAKGQAPVHWGHGEKGYDQRSDYHIVEIDYNEPSPINPKHIVKKLSEEEVHQLKVDQCNDAPHLRRFRDMLLRYKTAVVRARAARNYLAEDQSGEACTKFQNFRYEEHLAAERLMKEIEHELA